MLSTEELLKPRWKVIADFPFNTHYKVGGIITDHGECIYKNENGRFVITCDFDEYPHLFKRLEWYEGIDEKDMPEYLKYYEGEDLDFVLKVENYISHRDMKIFWSFEYLWNNEPDIKRMSLRGWQPATREEYEQYLSQQTNKK